jgi:hypothetical protein
MAIVSCEIDRNLRAGFFQNLSSAVGERPDAQHHRRTNARGHRAFSSHAKGIKLTPADLPLINVTLG